MNKINTFLITIDPDYEKELSTYGEVTFKSVILDRLYAIDTSVTAKELQKLTFVKSVEENGIGHLCI